MEESKELLETLYHLAVQKKNMTVFRWTPGSAVLWDNRAVWHCAVNNYKGMYRLMHRITLEGTYLESADPSQIGSMPLDDCGEVSISIACFTTCPQFLTISKNIYRFLSSFVLIQDVMSMGYGQIITDIPYVHNMLSTLETGTRNVTYSELATLSKPGQRLLLRALALVGIRPRMYVLI